MRVGIVGTGAMGRPLIDRVLANGHEVTAFARRTEVCVELTEAGVHVVETVSEIADGADVVIIYVYDDAQTRQLVLHEGILEAMAPGSALVIHTTGSPDTAASIERAAATRSIDVLDAAGSGGPLKVVAGELTLFVGGDATALDRVRPLLECYADEIIHFGPVGTGQSMKLLNNLVFGAQVQFVTEISRLAEAMGLDELQVLTAMHGASGGSAAINMAAYEGSSAKLFELARRFVHKDVKVALALAADLKLDLGTLGPVSDRILEQTADGGTEQ